MSSSVVTTGGRLIVPLSLCPGLSEDPRLPYLRPSPDRGAPDVLERHITVEERETKGVSSKVTVPGT